MGWGRRREGRNEKTGRGVCDGRRSMAYEGEGVTVMRVGAREGGRVAHWGEQTKRRWGERIRTYRGEEKEKSAAVFFVLVVLVA